MAGMHAQGAQQVSRRARRGPGWVGRALVVVCVITASAGSWRAHAQTQGAGARAGAGEASEAEQDAPTDTRSRLYRTIIRFVTDNDYPPFNYLDDEGTLAGFNVDIARAICGRSPVASKACLAVRLAESAPSS